MAKANIKMVGMDSLKNYATPTQIKNTQMKKKGKKMSSAMVAKRKKSMISNAASKTMGGLYSK